MIQLSRSVLRTFFIKGAFPTSNQFDAFISSVLNLNEDNELLGLNNYNETLIYREGNTVVHNGIIYQALQQTILGPFNIAHWEQITTGTTGLKYKGPWDANSNTPNLITIAKSAGDFYIVSVAGNTSLDGITNWEVGDWAITDGTVWSKIDNTDKVTDGVNLGTGIGLLKGLNGTVLEFKSLTSLNGSVKLFPNINEVDLAINFGDGSISASEVWSSFYTNQQLDTKEPLLGYPAENANKRVVAFSAPPLDTNYPSEKLVYDQLLFKQDRIPYITENVDNRLSAFQATPDNNHYISELLAFNQLALKEPTIAGTGSTADFYSGNKTFRNLGTDTRALLLSGLSIATNKVLESTDSIIEAFGYLQKQITDKVFGNNYQRIRNDSSTTNATTTFTAYPSNAAPMILTTPAIVGAFRLDWRLVVDNNKKLGEFRLVTLSGGVTTVVSSVNYEAANANGFEPVGAVTNIVQDTAVSKDYRIEYRASPIIGGGGGTQNVREGTMEFFRVL